jgi:manganese oxidase
MKNRRTKALLGALAIAAGILYSVPTSAQLPPLDIGPEDDACQDPTESVTLFADNISGGRVGYGLTPDEISVPGPTIELTEGTCMQVNLINDANERVSFHPHGVDYSVRSDGTTINGSCVPPGESKTYVINAHVPGTRADGTVQAGSAGYWHYHDHCLGTVHGTGGVKRGLFGALIVRRPGDPMPTGDPHVLVMSGSQFNLKQAPKTPMIRVNQGDRVEFVIIGHGELFHTFHLHGHRWADNRTGYLSSVTDQTTVIDNKVVGPADSFGFQVVAGEGVGPGVWMYHCHVQSHSDAGMSGLFVVRTPEGKVTAQMKRAIARWKEESGGHH